MGKESMMGEEERGLFEGVSPTNSSSYGLQPRNT